MCYGPQREILQESVLNKVISVRYREEWNENKTFLMGDIKEDKQGNLSRSLLILKSYFIQEIFKVILNYSSVINTQHVRFSARIYLSLNIRNFTMKRAISLEPLKSKKELLVSRAL